MLTIRFTRKGKKNQPFFRMVVCDKKNSAKAGKSLEILGNYNPITKEKGVKKERVEHWLKVGAQPSDRVHNFLISEGVIKGEKIAVHSKPKKKEGAEATKIVEALKAEAKIEAPKEEKVKEVLEVKPVEPAKDAKIEEKKEEAKIEEPKVDPS